MSWSGAVPPAVLAPLLVAAAGGLKAVWRAVNSVWIWPIRLTASVYAMCSFYSRLGVGSSLPLPDQRRDHPILLLVVQARRGWDAHTASVQVASHRVIVAVAARVRREQRQWSEERTGLDVGGGERRDHRVATAAPDRLLDQDRHQPVVAHRPRGFSREPQVRRCLKLGRVARRDRPPPSDEVVETFQLRKPDRGVQVRQRVVESDLVVDVLERPLYSSPEG